MLSKKDGDLWKYKWIRFIRCIVVRYLKEWWEVFQYENTCRLCGTPGTKSPQPGFVAAQYHTPIHHQLLHIFFSDWSVCSIIGVYRWLVWGPAGPIGAYWSSHPQPVVVKVSNRAEQLSMQEVTGGEILCAHLLVTRTSSMCARWEQTWNKLHNLLDFPNFKWTRQNTRPKFPNWECLVPIFWQCSDILYSPPDPFWVCPSPPLREVCGWFPR